MGDGVCTDEHGELEGRSMTRGCRSCHIADLEARLVEVERERDEANGRSLRIATERHALRALADRLAESLRGSLEQLRRHANTDAGLNDWDRVRAAYQRAGQEKA